MRAELKSDFVMSTEMECLTAVTQSPHPEFVVRRFLEIMASLAPSMPGRSGFFNPYGRVYIDCNLHIELAACECASPYDLPNIVERQQMLAAQAIQQLSEEHQHLLLANNNHSGLLTADAPTWGSHENYMTEQHATQFGEHILPFLVTRIYAGAGGINYPSADFLAAVRPLRMELASGGGTTEQRAIHSTARDEHHMGEKPKRFRYHLILGDGHASHFNLALQFGATALALKAIFFDHKLKQELKKFDSISGEGWVTLLKQLNVLAAAGGPLRVDPRVLEIQHLYLEAAQRYADSLDTRPDWIAGILNDWRQTLQAMERMDLDWLSARLDTFAKYSLYSAVLAEQGKQWNDLIQEHTLFNELALLDHSYHSFCDPNSVFRHLEKLGVLQHRVGHPFQPGTEAEPYVPNSGTRADARARFIIEHAEKQEYFVDWSFAASRRTSEVFLMCDPLTLEFERQPQTDGNLALKILRHAMPDSF
jgi:hypothetical protein